MKRRHLFAFYCTLMLPIGAALGAGAGDRLRGLAIGGLGAGTGGDVVGILIGGLGAGTVMEAV